MKLTKKDIAYLLSLGFEKEDISQIEEAIGKTTYELTCGDIVKKVGVKEAVSLLGREEFLSGISRSAFHFIAERPIKGESGSIYFDSSKLFK